MNPTVALNNDENLGVPEVSGKHGPAVANSGEPPTHGNDHSIPGDVSEHGNAPSHSHGKPGSEMNPIVALNNDENLGVPEVSGKHGPAVASPVANSGEPPTHGNDHSIPADVSEHGNAPSHSHGKPGSEMNPTVALNNDENLGVPEVSGKHGPAVASPVANSGEPPTHGNDHSIPGDASEHGNAPSHSHGKPGSEMNPIVALNNDENLGVPEASGKHGPAVASPVANSGEPPTHGNDHSIPGDASEHGNAPSHSHGKPGSEMNPIVALNTDENLGVPEVSGEHGPTVASPVANSGEPPTHGNDHSIPGDVSEHGNAPSHSHGNLVLK